MIHTMLPCNFCACTDKKHNEACPYNGKLDKLDEWNRGYNDGKDGNSKKDNDPTYVLGWNMAIHISKAEFLNHPGC